MPDPVLIDMFQRLAMALGIGFLVGIKRGWKHRDASEGTRGLAAALAAAAVWFIATPLLAPMFEEGASLAPRLIG